MSLKPLNQNQKKAEAKFERARVVFLLNSFGIGGIERQLLSQLHHYSREKYEIHLVTLYNYPDKDTLYGKLPPDIIVHRFHCVYGKLNLRELWHVAKLLKQLRPHLVVSSMFGPNTFNRILSIWLRYIPLPREHNTYKDRELPQRILEHGCSYISPTTVAVSNEVADFTAKQSWISRNRYTVIQNGVDLENIQSERVKVQQNLASLREEFSLSDNARVWLNVARLKPQKNHDLLIDSFAEHHNDYPDDHLCILGSGHEEGRLRKRVEELGLSNRIHLTGYRADVFSFYVLADYFILTSDIEGFPNVVLEAMAFGVPVLSTDVAGIDEIVVEGENGFVLHRSVASVRDTMMRVRSFSLEEIHSLQNNALQAVQKFSIGQTVRRYEELFDVLLK